MNLFELRYTSKNKTVYATVLKYTDKVNTVIMSAPKATESTTIELLGYSEKIQWSFKDAIVIDLSNFRYNGVTARWGLTFKITNLM